MGKPAVILAIGTTLVVLTLLTARLVTSTPEEQGGTVLSVSPPTTSAGTTDVKLKDGSDAPGVARASEEPSNQFARESEPGSVVSPILIPFEFDLVSPASRYWHNESWRGLHSRLEREPFDPSWTPAAEEAVRNAVTSNPEITSRGNPTINCRTTLCEVQMVVHGGDAKDAEWATYFNPVLKQLRAAGFNLEDMSTAHQDNVMAIVFVVSRGTGQMPGYPMVGK